MNIRIPFRALIGVFFAFASLSASAAEEMILHNGDTIGNLKMTWAADNPEAALELNTEKAFLSEGTGSILVRSVVPPDSSSTSYVGFRMSVGLIHLKDRVLTFDVWSTTPDATLAFHVRGLNARGQIVAGWESWSRPLEPQQQTMRLISGESGKLNWEEERIEAPDDEIAYLEFIIGSRTGGAAYNVYVDNIRLVPVENSFD